MKISKIKFSKVNYVVSVRLLSFYLGTSKLVTFLAKTEYILPSQQKLVVVIEKYI